MGHDSTSMDEIFPPWDHRERPSPASYRLGYKAINYTLWLFNIAMENGPFIDGLPLKNGDFLWLC